MLDEFVSSLVRWQRVKNLVGPRTLDDVWERHIADSAQLLDCLEHRKVLADLGSGAGFPGLVLAILLKGVSGSHVHLVESNGRKCGFLREVVRTLALPATVHSGRIEAVLPALSIEAVTARALAPLDKLLELTNQVLKGEALGVFPKGQDIDAELTQASKYWTFDHATVASRTDSKARILLIQNVRPASL
nr:16S rRNA (guanine(527)-N(7))-methyltransferase RsmG [Alsobacter metallidurans]